MAKSLSITQISLILRPKPTTMLPTKTPLRTPLKLFFSTTKTPYPLQYDMIISRPTRRQHLQIPKSKPTIPSHSDPSQNPTSESNFETWVDHKLAFDDGFKKISNKPILGNHENLPLEGGFEEDSNEPILGSFEMDKSKRKYYSKRRKRMYGSDSDDDQRGGEDKFLELEQEVVDLPTLHKKEEELYFYDSFAYPWEKDKHYKMVYQLEKKYFPNQCLDKAFVEPGESKESVKKKKNKKVDRVENKDGGGVGERDERGLVFFQDGVDVKDGEGIGLGKDVKKDVSEKKVEEFFKCLKKVPNEDGDVMDASPYIATRNVELPPQWDGPYGSVVLVNKPKGWTSFTVCGKLRRIVKVKKVGHAGTLDPMATGLLIVCVGKATKVVDRFQGMIKGYSGVFRLGEATSTWDADSPVIQREPWEHIKDEDIKKVAASFRGEIWQVPPMFSAIKVGGEKMYEKARRGESIELSPRRISIFQFDIERSLDDRQNLIFRVTCSKGTYIRSLCADLGKTLGSCAHLTALRRDSIGEYSADEAWEFKELEEAITKGYL